MSELEQPTGRVTFGNPNPVYVGGWQMGQFRFSLTKKPRWLTRVVMKWLLEWEWKDA